MKLALALLLAAASTARAGHDDLGVSGGANLGITMRGDQGDHTAGVIGVEGSVFWLHDSDDETHTHDKTDIDIGLLWAGLYTDLVYDGGAGALRASIGPEIGYSFIGIDGGLAEQLSSDPRHGYTLRLVLTTGIVTLYSGGTVYLDDRPDKSFVQLGILVKVPHMLSLKAPRDR